jgi:quaternary ammonium compound-resistance protein SugE
MASLSVATSAWTLLLIAGALEIIWSSSMKASEGFTKPLHTGITLIAALISFWLLGLAMKSLPLGTAYAVWTGIGAVGAAIIGMVIFQEPATAARILCIAAIVGGIVASSFCTEQVAQRIQLRDLDCWNNWG